MQSEPSGSVTSWILSPRQASAESTRIFDELPEASIVSGFYNVVDSLSSPTSVESTRIFDELPEASIVSVSRPTPAISAPLSSLTLLKFNTNNCAPPKLSPPLKFYSSKTLSSIEDLSSPHEGMV
uniref:Uncharacterized protein n=1 Tax=Fagus sylvatica TaxID=28930 RepID=A0A2N9EJX1_FAGSY